MGRPTPTGGNDERDGVPRRPPSLAPDLVVLAERVGKHDWNPVVSQDDEAEIAACCVAPLATAAAADPVAFLCRLADTCLPAGPWAAYGAGRLALRLFGTGNDLRYHPVWLELLDRSLSLCRTRLLPYPLLPTYLAEHFAACGGAPEDWLPFSEEPEPDEAAITPLPPGEGRTVVEGQLGSGLRVTVQRDGAQFVGLVELVDPAGGHEPLPQAVAAAVECWRADDLYDLYVDIAWAFPFRAWADPELMPFFPGPVPSGPS